MRLEHCPKCGNYPEINYKFLFLSSAAQVYCRYCGRQTDWHHAIWMSDASDSAKRDWNDACLKFKRKEKTLPNYCNKCSDKKRCEPYKDQVKKMQESEHEQVFDVFGEMRLKDCPKEKTL